MPPAQPPVPPVQSPVPPVQSPVPPVPPVPPLQPASTVPMAVPTLEMDTFCILFEGLTGFLRFRFNPGTTAENVSILLENPLTGAKVESRKMQFLQGLREITVPLPGQDAGAFVWYLTLTYEAAGRKRRMEGEARGAEGRGPAHRHDHEQHHERQRVGRARVAAGGA